MSEWKKYKRVVPTIARELSQQDVKELGGVVVSREGPKNVIAGDYMGRDEAGVWKISKKDIKNYDQQTLPDSCGWCEWQLKDPYCLARIIDHDFKVEGLQGYAGYYLVIDLMVLAEDL